ncbi:MAG: hypothetical protein ACRD96_14310, partial [Bryobacteraceae bacterium]
FAAVSLCFGAQALSVRPASEDEYTLRLAPWTIWKCVAFYSSQILLVPFAGLLLVWVAGIAAWFSRDRRVRFGLTMTALLLAPLLLLPGRLYAAYLYLPMAGLALAAAAPLRPAILALALAVWIPWNLHHLRRNRRLAQTLAAENRAYYTVLSGFARATPDPPAFVYDGVPAGLRSWGIVGAVRYLYRRGDLSVRSVEDAGALIAPSLALLTWNPGARQLTILARTPGTPDASFLAMNAETPVWQLGSGWYRLEGRFRWTQPLATARLHRPAAAREFELTVNIGPDLVREIGRTTLRVFLDGRSLGEQQFARSGWHTARWPLAPASAGPAAVEFRVDPEYRAANGDPRRLGIPIVSFGFRP